MKIKFVSPSPKAGETEHVSASIANNLIAAGFAELCPLPPRGSAGWLAARLEQTKMAGPPDRHDTVVPQVNGVEWGIRDRVAPNGRILIIKRFGQETVFYDETNIPKDCPSSIVDQFVALKNNGAGRAEELAEAQRKQQAYDNSVSTARRW